MIAPHGTARTGRAIPGKGSHMDSNHWAGRRCAACNDPSERTLCRRCAAWHRLGCAVECWAASRRVPDPGERRLSQRVRRIEDELIAAGLRDA